MPRGLSVGATDELIGQDCSETDVFGTQRRLNMMEDFTCNSTQAGLNHGVHGTSLHLMRPSPSTQTESSGVSVETALKF